MGMPCAAVALLAACGGAGSSPSMPSITTYEANATAGVGGSISPGTAEVDAGGTAVFTVAAYSGYTLSGVNGCGGTLVGNTYTTGTIAANCTVTASFYPDFTWVGGSNASDASGDYGTQGIAAAGNVPGARHATVTWTDAAGNLWLFGGYGVGPLTFNNGSPIFNDLWEYSPASGEWTWVSGSDTPDASASYGTQGSAASTNVPGAHGSSLAWTDASGNLWMFGGYGYDSTGAQGWLNTLSEYNPATGMWTGVGGSATVNAKGVYGTQGVAAATNVPGARALGPDGGLHSGGNVWLFGGYGYDSTGAQGWLNDLWEYSSASGEWTWVGGPDTANANGVYGTQGVAATANVPPPGVGIGWTDASGNLWVFGGYAQDSTGAVGYLNDLWEYSPASGEWTWVGGSATANEIGIYGTQGAAAAANVPGARENEAYWTDAAGNLWLFGGYGYDSKGTLGELNDMWKYSPATGMWTWVGGSDTANASAVYGTLGVAAPASIPGSREQIATWTGDNGNLWLFGGEGHNPTGADPTTPQWNDLWKYPTQ